GAEERGGLVGGPPGAELPEPGGRSAGAAHGGLRVALLKHPGQVEAGLSSLVRQLQAREDLPPGGEPLTRLGNIVVRRGEQTGPPARARSPAQRRYDGAVPRWRPRASAAASGWPAVSSASTRAATSERRSGAAGSCTARSPRSTLHAPAASPRSIRDCARTTM